MKEIKLVMDNKEFDTFEKLKKQIAAKSWVKFFKFLMDKYKAGDKQ